MLIWSRSVRKIPIRVRQEFVHVWSIIVYRVLQVNSHPAGLVSTNKLRMCEYEVLVNMNIRIDEENID